MTSTSDALRALSERGFVHQCTNAEALDAAFRQGSVTAYVGYDCTAPSLHVGSLVSIMMLRWLQKFGHRVIVLMGGGTTKIGDPSGKDEARKLLSAEEIRANQHGILMSFNRLLIDNYAVEDNASWLDGLSYVNFLREYGRHFSVNRMLTLDSVKLRLERDQALSFLEFNYSLLQAYDFVELAKRHECALQIGGSDQWGNIVSGIELGRKVLGRELFGLTCPLLTTSSGAKMGKTVDGAVWLNKEQRSPYDYWQFWRNTEDADVGRFLRLFTELPLVEVERLETLKGVETNEAKKVLATEATALCHGRTAAAEAEVAATRTFEQGGVAEGLPTVVVSEAELDAGILFNTLLRRAGLVDSNTEGRKLVKGGGARLNNDVVTDEKQSVTLADLNSDGVLKVSAGKKRHVLVKPG